MKEYFLHYLWKYKKFDTSNLKTIDGQEIIIQNAGQYTQLAGPDFFNAKLIINAQQWAGNVEIHVKSSDWYAHNHEKDSNYDNVILHVVWNHDCEIFRKDNSKIAVLELKNYVAVSTLENYQQLITPKSWIFCEKQINQIDEFVLKNWQERLFFERLERKSNPIIELAKQTNNDWEAVLFQMLAKNFGLNTNGETFLKIAQSIPYNIVRKESFEVENLEALIFGSAGLLNIEKEDTYYKDLKFRFFYLLHKHQIEETIIEPVQFFKHRPDNFPTIRLSQLANLYHKEQNLFSKIIEITTVKSVYDLLDISVSEYWKTHYSFDKESSKKTKALTKSFIDLLIINTLIPIKFAYAKSLGKEISEDLIELLIEIAPENNSIIDKFALFGVKAKSAFETQSLLQLKNEYCNKSKCLDCAVGGYLMK